MEKSRIFLASPQCRKILHLSMICKSKEGIQYMATLVLQINAPGLALWNNWLCTSGIWRILKFSPEVHRKPINRFSGVSNDFPPLKWQNGEPLVLSHQKKVFITFQYFAPNDTNQEPWVATVVRRVASAAPDYSDWVWESNMVGVLTIFSRRNHSQAT